MNLPRAPQFDCTLALLKQGYELILNTCRELDSDIFEGRLMLQKTIFMLGEDAARLFYDSEKIQRKGGMPLRIQKTLVGVGSVQTLDDEEHGQRKHLFVQQLMSHARIQDLKRITHDELLSTARTWQHISRFILLPELQLILCKSVCRWASVPLDEVEAKQTSYDLSDLIESAGKIGPAHWKGRKARRKLESWGARLVEEVRSGTLTVPEDSVLYAVAMHRDTQGELLEARIAAVELLNILRPTLAIARFMIFGALALHEHPQYRADISDDVFLSCFVQEVRRFYPFFPHLAARVRRHFEWRGYAFPKGRRVVLDLYGTNHDERIWKNPSAFEPLRFREKEISPYNFVPQGGGDYSINHRCPGENITVELMKVFLRFMTQDISYTVPKQDFTIKLSKIPALPESGFILDRVRVLNQQT